MLLRNKFRVNSKNEKKGRAMIRGVAFDLEGPTIDVEHVHAKAWNLVAKELGVEFDMIPFAGAGDEAIAKHLREKAGKLTIPRIRMKKSQEYESLLKSAIIKPRDGFIEAFNCIKRKRLPVAIGSLTPKARAEYLMKCADVMRLFKKSNMIFEEDVKNRKPAPDVFLATAKAMGIKPSEQLVFEDSVTGYEAAIAAGSPAVIVAVFDDVAKEAHKRGAQHVYTCWEEVNIHDLLASL